MQPRVTIVIPTFDRPHLLAQAIQSALQQTESQIEVLVSENAGPEVSEAVCKRFADPRVRFRRNATNLGIAGNIREATKEARGEYVAHLHDDDLLEPTFVERLLPGFGARSDVVVSFGDHIVIDAHGIVNEQQTRAFRSWFGRECLVPGVHRPFISLALLQLSVPPICLIRKAAISWDELTDQAGSAYDLYMHYLLSRGGMAAWYTPEPVYRYRLHGGQETAARLRMGAGILACGRAFLADPRLEAIRPQLAERFTSHLISHGLNLIRDSQPREARALLREALSRGGGSRARLGLLLSYAPLFLKARDRVAAGLSRS